MQGRTRDRETLREIDRAGSEIDRGRTRSSNERMLTLSEGKRSHIHTQACAQLDTHIQRYMHRHKLNIPSSGSFLATSTFGGAAARWTLNHTQIKTKHSRKRTLSKITHSHSNGSIGGQKIYEVLDHERVFWER